MANLIPDKTNDTADPPKTVHAVITNKSYAALIHESAQRGYVKHQEFVGLIVLQWLNDNGYEFNVTPSPSQSVAGE